jgi:hypothetical protein
MRVEVRVPQLPESVAEATLVSWHKKVGEAARRDENLIDIETDKVVLELPAPQDGRAGRDHQRRWFDGARAARSSRRSIPRPRQPSPRAPSRSRALRRQHQRQVPAGGECSAGVGRSGVERCTGAERSDRIACSTQDAG